MKKRESSNLDLLRFFPVWGKSVMDSIKKSMEDKTNSEEQVVTINMEDNNENSMDGGRGKRRRKKVSRKKKGGYDENENEGISWHERNEEERMREARFKSPTKQGVNQTNKKRPKKPKNNRVRESPTKLEERMNLTNPGNRMYPERNIPSYGRVERQLVPPTPRPLPLIKTPNRPVEIGVTETEWFRRNLRGDPTPSPQPLRPPNVVKSKLRRREEPSTLASRTSNLQLTPYKRNRRNRNEEEEGENEINRGPLQHRARIEHEEEEEVEEDEPTQEATQPATQGGKRKKTQKNTKKKSTKRRSKK